MATLDHRVHQGFQENLVPQACRDYKDRLECKDLQEQALKPMEKTK